MSRPLESADVGSLSLYMHIPFCETKCPYCDFNTYAGIETLVPSYIRALRTEIQLWGQLLGRVPVETVFFGGGTPSYLLEGCVGSALEEVRSAFALSTTAEVTLEANPDDVTDSKLAAYLGYGVNRISIGVQSLDDRLLKLLGRRHSAAQALGAYRQAVGAGFTNVSVDLMYGLPHQSVDDWERTLDGVVDLEPAHVSMYCLTLEGGTPMERWVKEGTLPDPDPDAAADMYEMAEEVLAARGYRHYEISNWARPGFESRHNLTYWRNQAYLGVGPGAHSYLGGHRYSNLRSPRDYIRKLGEDSSTPAHSLGSFGPEAIRSVPVVETLETISPRLEMAETMMMGLRLDEGIEEEGFTRRFGVPPADVFGDDIEEAAKLGLLEAIDGRLRLTARGRLLGNEVFSRFFV